MLSKPLLKASVKLNYIVFIIIVAVLMMYLPIIISMYNPETQDSLNEMLKALPPEMVAAMGFGEIGGGLLSFIGSYFYGFLILLLPMIYAIVVANRSIASHVDKGSMAYLLSTPNTRLKIARTQAFFLIVTVTLLIAIVTMIGIALSSVLYPGELDVSGFLLLNAGVLLLYYALTGIGFFASCFFNDTKNSLAVGAGLPVAFLVLQMISNTGKETEFLRYFTIYTLFSPKNIINGENFIISFLALAVIAIVAFTSSLYAFHKRDLPL
ncbi:MAG: putative rane protein [Herbinix sp.]|jgi:ABC-2 type transport system permease protein|nr:putative rane protein [Herbinix sp.]